MKKYLFLVIWLVLAAVCFVYGLIVLGSGSGTGFFIVWMGCAVIFMIIAAAGFFGIWGKIPKTVKIIGSVVVLAGVVCFIFAECCIISKFDDKGQDNLDYIIVLGAQVKDSGPSIVLKHRLNAAIDYLEKNPDTICIVSGGQGYNEPYPEAQGMAEYMKNKGIDESRIIEEDESLTTSENIKNSMEYISDGATVGIVTNNFHVFRALLIAKREGLKNVCGIAAKTTPIYLPNNMFREFFAIIKFLTQL